MKINMTNLMVGYYPSDIGEKIIIMDEVEVCSVDHYIFEPVLINNKRKIRSEDVKLFKDVFYIHKDEVDNYLLWFLFAYFKNEEPYNKYRYDDDRGYLSNFSWCMDYNFYTYDDLKIMIREIKLRAELLKIDYNNFVLNDIKEFFPVYMDTSKMKNLKEHLKSEEIKNPKDMFNYVKLKEEIKRFDESGCTYTDQLEIVVDFYERFCDRLHKMMIDNPQTNVIAIRFPEFNLNFENKLKKLLEK